MFGPKLASVGKVPLKAAERRQAAQDHRGVCPENSPPPKISPGKDYRPFEVSLQFSEKRVRKDRRNWEFVFARTNAGPRSQPRNTPEDTHTYAHFRDDPYGQRSLQSWPTVAVSDGQEYRTGRTRTRS